MASLRFGKDLGCRGKNKKKKRKNKMNKKICRILPLLAIVGMLNSCACSEVHRKFSSKNEFLSNNVEARKVRPMVATTPEHAVIDKSKERESLKENLVVATGIIITLTALGGCYAMARD